MGRRRTFVLGAVVFTCASLACGVAPGAGALIVARILQSCGAAFLSPAALSLVTTTFPAGRERSTAVRVWAALAGLGGTLGVIVGGLVTESLSWRLIKPDGRPRLQAALLALAFRNEYRVQTSRPFHLDLALCALIAPISLACGYRPTYRPSTVTV